MLGGRERKSARTAAVSLRRTTELRTDLPITRGDVADTRARLLPAEDSGALADVFKLLGEPNRVRILYALLEAGELCVCDLAAAIDASETAVSHAMRLLRGAGIVRNRRDGRLIFYRLADDHVRALLERSREHQEAGSRG